MKHAENNKKNLDECRESRHNRNQKLLFQSAEPNYGLLETKNFWVIDMMGMEHDDTKKKKNDYL